MSFQKHGAESAKALKQLESAVAANGYVPDYLLGRKRLPEFHPDSYSPESPEEAVIYASEAMGAWKNSPGALKWLANRA